MNKDTQTTIAGVVGALALLVQWILGTFFAYKLEIGADVLNAIAILAGLFVAYKVGKPNASTTIKLFLIVALVFGFALSASAQTWTQGNKLTAAWDAVTSATGTISYKIYYKPYGGAAGTEKYIKEVTTTQAEYTVAEEGRFVLGVATKKTVGADSVESSISWSDNPAVTFQAQTFGLFYLIPAEAPVGIRKVN